MFYLIVDILLLLPYTCYLILFCQTLDLGLRLGVDFTFTLDNNDNNDNHNNNDNDNNNPHLYFFKGTVQGVKEQGIRNKG